MEALTIKTFKTSKISAVEVRENRSQEFKYKSIRFTYDGAEVPPIRVDGNFRVFKFDNKNGPVYSLVINCTGDNESFFRKLNTILANQSCKILKDHTRDRNMGLLVQSISTFNIRLTYAVAPDSHLLISHVQSHLFFWSL